MKTELEPHSKEWFAALETFAPMQASQTRRILQLAVRDDVCSVCGAEDARAFRIISSLPAGAPNTIRLCDDCRRMRSGMHAEQYERL